MELTAIIKALECLESPCRVLIRSDSRICVNLVNKTAKKSRKNLDLIAVLNHEMANHPHVGAIWVKGHAGDTDNERCDLLAERATMQKMTA